MGHVNNDMPTERTMDLKLNPESKPADGNQITTDDIGLNRASDDDLDSLDLRQVREDAEKRVIINALGRVDGNVLRAAEMLGVSRPTLYDLMHRYGLK